MPHYWDHTPQPHVDMRLVTAAPRHTAQERCLMVLPVR